MVDNGITLVIRQKLPGLDVHQEAIWQCFNKLQKYTLDPPSTLW